MYIYIHTYLHIYVHIYKHICIRICIYTYIYVCVYIYTQRYIRVHIYLYKYIYGVCPHAKHCKTMQHTATHCTTLQHTANTATQHITHFTPRGGGTGLKRICSPVCSLCTSVLVLIDILQNQLYTDSTWQIILIVSDENRQSFNMLKCNHRT